jgi:serine/threonine-protein kinase
VKPSNLLADNQGNLKLLDMGLSRLEDVEDVAGNRKPGTYLLGTCDYMAPEQAADPQAACPRSDIYSLGATLFFVLIGQPMYCGGSGFDRVLAHRQAPPPSLRDARPEVPAGLEAIYRRMVAKQPTDRFATMTEVRQALEGLGLAGGSDLAARVATYRGQPVTPSRPISTSGESLGATGPSRQGWLLALLLAIVLGLLSWAVVISLSTPRS